MVGARKVWGVGEGEVEVDTRRMVQGILNALALSYWQ